MTEAIAPSFADPLLPDLRVRGSTDDGMKRCFTTVGLVLSFACKPLASDLTALARVTVYWPTEGSGKSAAWNGAQLREYHCAVDPKEIPYGSKVTFDDGECIAVDTGPDVVNPRPHGHVAELQLSKPRLSLIVFSTRKKELLPGKGPIRIS
jgi:hypothetical protein